MFAGFGYYQDDGNRQHDVKFTCSWEVIFSELELSCVDGFWFHVGPEIVAYANFEIVGFGWSPSSSSIDITNFPQTSAIRLRRLT